MNIGKDGMTNQNVAIEWCEMRSASPVSNHIHIIPRTEINGKEAIRPPKPGYFLETSDTIAIIKPDNIALIDSEIRSSYLKNVTYDYNFCIV